MQSCQSCDHEVMAVDHCLQSATARIPALINCRSLHVLSGWRAQPGDDLEWLVYENADQRYSQLSLDLAIWSSGVEKEVGQ